MLIQKALQEGPFNLRDLADEMGGSYGTLREWSRGARTPRDENVRQIADAFERRAQRLLTLAKRLRGTVELERAAGEE
ncbi:MAG: helix-turn-helix transcriptional regulator [Gemmatimonadetes bacterium]|nr:helix-turn-helix transcriptional regulator [Gemmatimonadota bacterium]MBA4160013.1 helix-turn-helix transcriptional regulator [Gemmatimonadota bacterium]